MTQEEKAYDEALERARIAYKDEDKHLKATLKRIFPELEKSEDENVDEKVRKALIKLVTNHASMDLFIEYDIHLDEALAWFEKHNEQKPTDDFVEKAWDWIEDNLLSSNQQDKSSLYCEQFRKYIKGI